MHYFKYYTCLSNVRRPFVSPSILEAYDGRQNQMNSLNETAAVASSFI
jgi:hypothetical protein